MLLASAARPLAALASASPPCSSVPCLGAELCCDGQDCYDPRTETCCTGGTACDRQTSFCCGTHCLGKNEGFGCCHGHVYDARIEKCCPQGQACFKNETCCSGTQECCKKGETCCGIHCLRKDEGFGCCHGHVYDARIEKCCPQGQACFKNETCCGGQCCGNGHHCVTCGSGKKLCCPDGEYCCNGVCCKPKNCKHGVCQAKCLKPGFPPSYTTCGSTCCGGATPVCCTSPSGAACCGPGQACCGGATPQCVTPAPAGDYHFGNYDGQPNENVFCCPGGSGGTCGNNPGESHPACRAGNFGCVCSSGTFCPVGGCCDIFGGCKNPC